MRCDGWGPWQLFEEPWATPSHAMSSLCRGWMQVHADVAHGNACDKSEGGGGGKPVAHSGRASLDGQRAVRE